MSPFENELFQLEQVEPGLWLLSEKMIRYSIRANVWVIEGKDADLVIDAGWGVVDWPMELLFPDQEKPLWHAITHAHCDHINQHARFKDRRFGHAEALEIIRAPNAKNTNAQPWTPQLKLIDEGYEYLGFDDQTYGENFAPSDLTDLVGDGDRIDLGDVVLEVMETPGHSPDSLTFVDHARKWMFTGDVLINGYIVDVLHHSNKEDVLRSHQRLMAQDFEQVFGGHQYPLDREKAERVVSRYIEHKAKEGIQLDS